MLQDMGVCEHMIHKFRLTMCFFFQTDAQTHTGDVQNHLLKGRGEIVEKNYILFIQNSLERAEVAMYSVLGINTSVETSTISNLSVSYTHLDVYKRQLCVLVSSQCTHVL